MAIRTSRLSNRSQELTVFTGINKYVESLGNLTETIDKTVSFSEQRNLVNSTVLTLNETIKDALDTSKLSPISELLLGDYVTTSETKLLSGLEKMSGVLLTRLDVMASSVRNEFEDGIHVLSKITNKLDNLKEVYSSAAACALTLESIIESKDPEALLEILSSFEEDSMFGHLFSFAASSLVTKNDFVQLRDLVEFYKGDYKDDLKSFIYTQMFNQLVDNPKDNPSLTALVELVNTLKPELGSDFDRMVVQYKPDANKVERTVTALKAINTRGDIDEELTISDRPLEVLLVKAFAIT